MTLPMRIRREAEANYNAVFIDGCTLRTPIDPTKPITELRFPEFYDISAGNKCVTGQCPWCYAAAAKSGVHYTNLVAKVEKFFGTMTENQRPFQCAVGGEQEPLENPEIWDMMEKFRQLGIIPNYTTNGVLVTDEVVEKTLKVCGGAAVTLHPHLEKHWRQAIHRLAAGKVKLNVHVIISDAESINYTEKLYDEFVETGMVDYFVLLPYMNTGHAANRPRSIDEARLEKWLDRIYVQSRVAFGANFYNFIRARANKYNVSIYPPESFSKYLIMNDDMVVANNSFEKRHVGYTPGIGCELGRARMNFDIPA